jgi:SAM-dependent methyltransferase
MEEAMPWVMARTLLHLGAFAPGRTVDDAVGIGSRHGLSAHHAAVVAHWLRCLAEAGLVQPHAEPGVWRATAGLQIATVEARTAELLRQLPIDGGESWQPLLAYFREHAAQQLAVLKGQRQPLELLFPAGDWHVADALYRDNPVNRILNDSAAALLSTWVDAQPPTATVQVLEVGAGTGGTTHALLPVLPAARTRYRCTDVTAFFQERARRRFAAYGFVDYGVYNIDQPPEPQGLAPHSLDVVVAANVLHDARDIDATLRQLRRLLKPGGLLLAVGATQPSAMQLGTVALLERFGRPQDLRRTSGPALMTAPQWRACAQDAGFARLAALPEDSAFAAMPQQLHVAQAPAAVTDAAALDQALRRSLPSHLVPGHFVWLARLPLSRNGKLDLRALPPPWPDAASGCTSPRTIVEPRNTTELLVTSIWREALSDPSIGVHDGFLSAGGDSLNAARIASRLQQRLLLDNTAHDILLRRLLADTTPEALAREIDALAAAAHTYRETHLA